MSQNDNSKTELDSNKKINTYLKNARKIKQWMEEKNTTKPPSRRSTDINERKLANVLSNIRQKIIKPYKDLKTEEKEEYRRKYPYIDEITEIVNWIDENNKELLRNAKDIQAWMNENNATKPPSENSKDITEKRLGTAFSTLMYRYIKPYKDLKTEEEKEEYKKKYPDIDEIIEIVDTIKTNKKTKSTYLKNARDARGWMHDNDIKRSPRNKAKDEEERSHARALSFIRYNLIKPYLNLETEEEKEKFRKEHPEIDELMLLFYSIYKNDNGKEKEELLKLILIDQQKRIQVAEAKILEKRYKEELEKQEANTKEEGVIHDE